MLSAAFEAIIRDQRTAILGALIRSTGNWDLAEDSVQEACARAWEVWSRDGLPDRPGAWLTTVARRIALDQIRRDRRMRELPDSLNTGEGPPEPASAVDDDILRLIFTCCHPSLNRRAQIALTLRTVCGLSTREIARAFVESEVTTAQRLVRAKRKLADQHVPFDVPANSELAGRLDSVLLVVYLVFNEGYAASTGPSLLRPGLSGEAIRLGRLLHRLLPAEPEAAGLLALMLLHDSRRTARLSPEGDLIPLEEQDRTQWDANRIREGLRILDEALARRRSGPYQIQAAIAALHARAQTPAETDWTQIAALYAALLRFNPGPIVQLNAAVAMAMAGDSPRAIEWMDSLAACEELCGYYLLPASRADLLRRAGRTDEALRAYEQAIREAPEGTERRYLERRVRELRDEG